MVTLHDGSLRTLSVAEKLMGFDDILTSVRAFIQHTRVNVVKIKVVS